MSFRENYSGYLVAFWVRIIEKYFPQIFLSIISYRFIIVASYTANLAAFFTKARLESSIESLDDLDDQYRVSYAPINNSDEMIFFKRMKDIEQMLSDHWINISLDDTLTGYERAKYAVWEYPVATKYTKLWEAMERTKFPNSISEAIQRVENSTAVSGFAFLGDATDINYLTRNNCQFQVVGEEFSRKPYAIGIQQGSPLKTEIDEILLNLLSTRWLEERKKLWWPKRTCANDAHFDGIHFTHILGFFIVIACGILMSLIAMIMEYFWFRHRLTEIRNSNVPSVCPTLPVTPKSVLSNANDIVAESEEPSTSYCRNRGRNSLRRTSRVSFE